MKHNDEEISELHDLVLIQAVQRCYAAEAKRMEAASHPKFSPTNAKNVGKFPTPNPAFLELKEALEAEMTKRNLTME